MGQGRAPPPGHLAASPALCAGQAASPRPAPAAPSPRGEHRVGRPGTRFWPERGAFAVGVTPHSARVPVPQPGAAHGDLTRPVPTQPAQLCPDKH